jgi:CheY-like chemotaxis protein
MPSVLVIDDDAGIRRMIVRILAAAGHEVSEAADGQEGLQRLREHRHEIVITDIVMPEQEGIETIRRIRAVAPQTRIIAISGGGSTGTGMYLKLAKRTGADITLAKPFRARELLALLDGFQTNENPAIALPVLRS